MKEEIEWRQMSCHEDRDMPSNWSTVILKLKRGCVLVATYIDGEFQCEGEQVEFKSIQWWAYMPKGPQ